MTAIIRHHPGAPRWRGRAVWYQQAAISVWVEDRQRPALPWSYITTDCSVPMCLVPECLVIHSPKRIDYPAGICTYCGDPSGTIDHLLPKPITGVTLRRVVVVVPACGNCNSRIGDHPDHNITSRRHRAQASIHRTNRHLIDVPEKTPDELSELGYAMRSVSIKNALKRTSLKSRLSWPDDPFYDIRAFEKSGVLDADVMGLCDRIALPYAASKHTA